MAMPTETPNEEDFMQGKMLSTRSRATLAIFTVTVFVTTAGAATEKVLHSFNGTGGGSPWAGVISDVSGNLYGTTYGGGAHSAGTVFELTPTAGGNWKETVLHSFNPNGRDGYHPYAGLVLDTSGNLYGTTTYGGAYSSGVVFELALKAGGGWTEKVLHSFNGTDGYHPYAGLIFDGAGNLYGTTTYGGAGGAGVVFELTPKAGGGWTEKVLHGFNGTDGAQPYAGLIFDVAGNLYGTTQRGGPPGCYADYGCGMVFELAREANRGWTEKVLHTFRGKDGAYPYAGLIFNSSNLYGTTAQGGPAGCDSNLGCGTVFELTPKAHGGWTEKVLHNFIQKGRDGVYPYAGLIFDGAGNLYGTALNGGAYNDGTVFELTPKAGGGWTEKVLHSFIHNGTDGYNPNAGLIFDDAGNLYGTALNGGAYNDGTVFELTPSKTVRW
jgi:uncharacterized repeat protein (TIGR03803 family)